MPDTQSLHVDSHVPNAVVVDDDDDDDDEGDGGVGVVGGHQSIPN